MALVMRGSTPCAICHSAVEEGDEIVSTSHFSSGPFDPFNAWSDVPFHQRCFDEWPRRRDFIGHYNALSVRRVWPDGLVFRMDERGHVTRVPAENAVSEPLPNVALELTVSRRRPGIFLIHNPHGDLVPARLIVAIPSGGGKGMRVWPIARLTASEATDEHAAAIRELDGPPAGMAERGDRPGMRTQFFEAGAESDEMAMGAGAHFVIHFPADLEPAEITCWAQLG